MTRTVPVSNLSRRSRSKFCLLLRKLVDNFQRKVYCTKPFLFFFPLVGSRVFNIFYNYNYNSRAMNKQHTSTVWSYFAKLDNTYAKCNICHNNYSYKTTLTNLKKHLSGPHGVVLKQQRRSHDVSNEFFSITYSHNNSDCILLYYIVQE